VIVEAELDKMVYRLQGDIEQAGMKFDDYMAQLGKSTEEMRKELRPDAEKRAKFELVLHGIAEKEKLVPEEKEIEEQVKHLLDHYKGADPIRARVYIENIMRNELVFKFLEK
jgi:trigger factor